MNFGQAIEALKQGKRIARAGWNGKGMYVTLIGGDAVTLAGNHVAISPCMGLKTPGNTMQPGWNASTPDVLAEDWEVAP